MLDWLIIGGGVTGLTCARLLQLKGQRNVLVLERESQVGGLCQSAQYQDHVIDTGGGHFLCSKYPDVYEFIWAHLPRSEFNSYKRVSKIAIGGLAIDYPLEAHLWQLPKGLRDRYLQSLQARVQMENPATFDEWCRSNLGACITDDYFTPYNHKVWGVSLGAMDVDWLHKIPRLSYDQILKLNRDCVAGVAEVPSHATFMYPKEGGFGRIAKSIYAHVSDQVLINTPVTSCIRKGDQWHINSRYIARNVITTAPWSVLADGLSPLPRRIRHLIARLRACAIVVELYEKDYDHDWHWQYLPAADLMEHREFFIGNYCPSSSRRGVFAETGAARFKSSARTMVSYYNHTAYPVPIRGHNMAARTVLEFYGELRMYGLGRWGQHRYHNSDVCIKEAMNFIDAQCL